MKINPNLLKLAEQTYDPDLKETSILAQKVADPNISQEFSINNNPNFWAVTGVNYRDGIYHVDLHKELLDNGDSKTQDQWSEYSKTNEFKLGDFPLYHSLFQALSESSCRSLRAVSASFSPQRKSKGANCSEQRSFRRAGPG